MGNIIPFLRDCAFGPEDISACREPWMICAALQLPERDKDARRMIAERIISLAKCGERSAVQIRDRVLKEATAGVA